MRRLFIYTFPYKIYSTDHENIVESRKSANVTLTKTSTTRTKNKSHVNSSKSNIFISNLAQELTCRSFAFKSFSLESYTVVWIQSIRKLLFETLKHSQQNMCRCSSYSKVICICKKRFQR